MTDLPAEVLETEIADSDKSELSEIGYSPARVVEILCSFLGNGENRTIVPESSMHVTVSKIRKGYAIVSGTKFTRYYYDFDKQGNLIHRSTEWPEGFCSLLDKKPTVSALSRVLNHILDAEEEREH